MRALTHKDVMAQIRILSKENKPFDIVFCSYDEKRDTGGERKSYKKVFLHVKNNKSDNEHHDFESANSSNSKNPHHKAHGTFNIIKEPCNPSSIRTICLYLIEKFNNQEVMA